MLFSNCISQVARWFSFAFFGFFLRQITVTFSINNILKGWLNLLMVLSEIYFISYARLSHLSLENCWWCSTPLWCFEIEMQCVTLETCYKSCFICFWNCKWTEGANSGWVVPVTWSLKIESFEVFLNRDSIRRSWAEFK